MYRLYNNGICSIGRTDDLLFNFDENFETIFYTTLRNNNNTCDGTRNAGKPSFTQGASNRSFGETKQLMSYIHLFTNQLLQFVLPNY